MVATTCGTELSEETLSLSPEPEPFNLKELHFTKAWYRATPTWWVTPSIHA